MNAKFIICPTCGTNIKSFRIYRCPKCGAIMCERCTPYRHCFKCGQEITWRDQIGSIE